MSRAIVLKLESNSALAAVVRDRAGAVAVEAIVRIPLPGGNDAQSASAHLAQALAAYVPSRTPTVVAIPRSDLYWQSIDLPPAPADDLPDLVHLQAQRDLPLADDGAGFDFVPLEGDESHPHRVLGVGVTPQQLERVRRLCDAAGLKLDRVVPEPLGWPEVGQRADDDLPRNGGVRVFAAMADRQATVWATERDALRLLRTIRLPAEADAEADAAVLAGELRRTLIALAQRRLGESAANRVASDSGAANSVAATLLPCIYCGENAPAVAERLSAALGREISAVDLATIVDASAAGGAANLSELAPLVGLAIATAQRRPPLADLVHPRRRPAPPSQRRTFTLAAAAALLVAGVLGWKAYRNIQGPLQAAAEADAARAELAPELETLGKDEQQATAIQGWLDQSLNLLTELDFLGKQLRPQPLDSKEFKADEDLVVTKLAVANRQLTVDAAARSSRALPPAENRLRLADYRVDRRAVDADAKAVPEYTVSVSAVLERGGAAAAGDSGGGP